MEKTIYTCEKGKWVIAPCSDLFMKFDEIIDSDCEKCEYRNNFACELKRLNPAYVSKCKHNRRGMINDVSRSWDNEKSWSYEKENDAYIQRLDNLNSLRWSDKEINVIAYCRTPKEAWTKYNAKFGDCRSRKAVANKFKRI
ncbi:MAG: hypothetical protein M0R51_15410 [Clostridia bacterium]|jgi:hypothetical protein|nr:hypothetical protein [Clostridia bacterium]